MDLKEMVESMDWMHVAQDIVSFEVAQWQV
jgi:hypothetical protein